MPKLLPLTPEIVPFQKRIKGIRDSADSTHGNSKAWENNMFIFDNTYSLKEAAAILGFRSPSSLRAEAASHKIPQAFKNNKGWHIPKDYIQQRLQKEAESALTKNKVGRKRGQALHPTPDKE